MLLAMKTLYLGNLSYQLSEDELKTALEQYGTVHSIDMICNNKTGRPRGFAFAQMEPAHAEAALKALQGSELDGRALKIQVATSHPRG